MIRLQQKYLHIKAQGRLMTRKLVDYLATCDGKVDINKCMEIAREAGSYGLWVYKRDSKNWDSASSFADGIWNYRVTGTDHYNDIEFRDPLEGIIAGHLVLSKELNKLSDLQKNLTEKLAVIQFQQTRLEMLTKKVIEYDRRD